MSTGMFPQEFIIRFAEVTGIAAVTVDSYNGMKDIKLSLYLFDFLDIKPYFPPLVLTILH